MFFLEWVEFNGHNVWVDQLRFSRSLPPNWRIQYEHDKGVLHVIAPQLMHSQSLYVIYGCKLPPKPLVAHHQPLTLYNPA